VKGTVITVGPTGSETWELEHPIVNSIGGSDWNTVSTMDGCQIAAVGSNGNISLLDLQYCL
jgi:hypothetical protein